MHAADLFLKLLDGVVDEFYFFAALFADKVIVMMHAQGFVAHHAFLEVHGRGDARFTEQLEGAVYRDLPHGAVLAAYQQKKFFHGYMVVGMQEGLQYFQPLGRDAEAFLLEIFGKLAFCFHNIGIHR